MLSRRQLQGIVGRGRRIHPLTLTLLHPQKLFRWLPNILSRSVDITVTVIFKADVRQPICEALHIIGFGAQFEDDVTRFIYVRPLRPFNSNGWKTSPVGS